MNSDLELIVLRELRDKLLTELAASRLAGQHADKLLQDARTLIGHWLEQMVCYSEGGGECGTCGACNAMRRARAWMNPPGPG